MKTFHQIRRCMRCCFLQVILIALGIVEHYVLELPPQSGLAQSASNIIPEPYAGDLLKCILQQDKTPCL